MTIEFEVPKPIANQQVVLKTVGEEIMRLKSREFDENEHEIPWNFIEFMHNAMRAMGGSGLAPRETPSPDSPKTKWPPIAYQLLATQIEALAWGDLGMYHCLPGGGLGAAAIYA